MKKELRFSPRVESALMELAGLPWDLVPRVNCELVCPMAAMAAAKVGGTILEVPEYLIGVEFARQRLGLSHSEAREVADAADCSDHYLRPRLLELLGVTP